MVSQFNNSDTLPGVLARLRRDKSGNTMILVAASLLPMLAMVGGGIDMGRGYIAQSRLQQACDAGVLAARKVLGSQAAVDGTVPSDVADVGHKFFNLNFRDGSYGSTDRDFKMILEQDYSITGEASVKLPTTLMRIFAYKDMDIAVGCEARLDFQNTDVMMVLDTTGSMRDTLSGDSSSKIDSLRSVVTKFHAQLEAAKPKGTRIRYGFVPYSITVNVGWDLESGWLVDDWKYQGRKAVETGKVVPTTIYSTTFTYISGTKVADTMFIGASCPSSTLRTVMDGPPVAGPNSVTITYIQNGSTYDCKFTSAGKVEVTPTNYTNYKFSQTRTATGTKMQKQYAWRYAPMAFDVKGIKDGNSARPPKGGSIESDMGGTPDATSKIKSWFRGCIEERSTYEITDYGNVDFGQALDLDLDLVPSEGDPDTQWRPMFHEFSYVRSLEWNGRGNFSPASVDSGLDFVNAQTAMASACPAPAHKLSEMDAGEISAYLATLRPEGSTYHDIGMIWGGRYISPNGLFANENADTPGAPTKRNLIFLTDGLTSPLDITYGAYGIEPLDRRRWSTSSTMSLTDVIEKRFTVACNEVKKRNVTVWVIGFGQSLNPVLTECAGPGHSFEAKNADELNKVFSRIARTIGDLRLVK